MKATSISGTEVERALSNVSSASTSQERAKVKLRITATPECRLAEALQLRHPAPASDWDRSAMAKLLKPNDQTSTGQFISHQYLSAFRQFQKQIDAQMKAIARKTLCEETLPKNQPLMIKGIKWPALPSTATQEEQKAVAELREHFMGLISSTISNRIGDFEFKGVKFSNCELNDFDFASGIMFIEGKFSQCKLGGCQFGSANFSDSEFTNDKNVIQQPSESNFRNIKLPAGTQETDPGKYFDSMNQAKQQAKQEAEKTTADKMHELQLESSDR